MTSQEEEWKRQIKEAAKSNMFHFGSNRELRRLPYHLHDGEEIISIVTGSRKDKRGRGLIVATNERLFFLWDGWVFREHNDLPYSSLNSIEFKTGIFFGEIEAFSAGDSVAYNWVDRFSGRKFVKLVRQLSADAKRNHNMNMWNQTQQGDPTYPEHTQPQQPRLSAEEERTLAITSQLKQLKELLDSGIISPEEYDSKRQLLVNSL